MSVKSLTMAYRLEEPEALIAAYGTYAFSSITADQALKGLQEGIALIQKTGKLQHVLPMFYVIAADWLHSSGQYADAEDYYHKSIPLYRQMGAVDFLVFPLARLGHMALQENRLRE